MADLFILPSIGPKETWGLVINEVMACGLPFMASKKCGGAMDLIDDSTGWIFDPGQDIEAMARLLNKLVEDKRCCKKWVNMPRRKFNISVFPKLLIWLKK